MLNSALSKQKIYIPEKILLMSVFLNETDI